MLAVTIWGECFSLATVSYFSFSNLQKKISNQSKYMFIYTKYSLIMFISEYINLFILILININTIRCNEIDIEN